MNGIRVMFSRLWTTVTQIPRQLVGLWHSRKLKPWRAVRMEEFPDHLEPGKVYLAGEGDNIWAAAMICPCGCGEVIELNLLKQTRPCWSFQEHANGTISLAPSVWRRKGCRSHFYLRGGRIEWY